MFLQYGRRFALYAHYGKHADGREDYVDRANIAGLEKVADAMPAQGLYWAGHVQATHGETLL